MALLVGRLKSYIRSYSERGRNLLFSGVASLFGNGINFVFQIISTPILLNYLGREKFGLYSVLLSTMALFGFADLGMGMGLQNRLSEYIPSRNLPRINELISTSFFLLLAFSIFLAALVFLWVNYIFDISSFFNINEVGLKREFSFAFQSLLLMFLLSVPFSLASSISSAFQRSYYIYIVQGLGKVLSLLLLLLLVFLSSGLTEFLVSQKLVEVCLFVILYLVLLSYLALQVMAVIINSVDGILITKYLGSGEMTKYTVVNKVVLIFTMPFTPFIVHIFSALNDAFARQDLAWVKLCIQKSIRTTIIVALFSGPLFYFFINDILDFWLGGISISDFEKMAFC
jgi:O-antigen/teichoic acid export membrane protein